MRRWSRWFVFALVLTGSVPIVFFTREAGHTETGDLEAIARAYLHTHAGAAGLSMGALELVELQESPGAHHARFQQSIAGVPVFGGYATVSIPKHSDAVSFALDRRRPVFDASAAGVPVDETEAVAHAMALTGTTTLRDAAAARTVYVPIESKHVLGWEVTLPALRPYGDWLVLLQASDGAALLKRDLLRYDSGQVFDPNPVVSSGAVIPPPNDCESGAHETALATEYETKPLLGIQAGQNKLKGDFVDLTAPGIVGSIFTAGQANEPSRNYIFPCDDQRFEEVMVYHHVDAAQRKIQALGFNGNSSILARPLPAHAHFEDGSLDFQCNAFYSPLDRGIHMGEGSAGTCADIAEDADFILHEYGHALQDDQVPGWGFGAPLAVEQTLAMGEGFGDYLAAAVTGDPCWSEWAITGPTACNGSPGLRWLQTSKVFPADFEACRGTPSSPAEPHCAGDIWSAALWDLSVLLGDDQDARDLVLKLALDAHFYLDPVSTFSDGAAAIVQADIDLFAGVHSAGIQGVFQGRGISVSPSSDEPSLYFRILHEYRGDLEVRVKVGSLAAPLCTIPLFSPDIFDANPDYLMYFDPSATPCVGFFPPSPSQPWYLEVRDAFALSTGTIADFQISLAGKARCFASDVPVAIPDAGAAVASMIDCSTAVKGIPPTPTPTVTSLPSPSATPTPTPSSSPTLTATATATAVAVATATPSATIAPPAATSTPTPTPTASPTPSPTSTPARTSGDANCSGTVTPIDAALILQLDAGIIPLVSCPDNADVNRDGGIGSLDAALVLQYSAGIVDMLPAGQRPALGGRMRAF
jgi:hypothetical protein